MECAYPHPLRFLAPLIRGFLAQHPDVKLAVNGLPGLPEVDRLIAGQVDVMTALPRTDPRIEGVELGVVRIVLVVPAEHPWRERAYVEVDELAECPVLIGPPASLSRRLLEPALRERGVALDIVHESRDFYSLTALAQAGLGVAVTADDHLPGEPADHGWPVLRHDGASMAAPVWSYWSAERTLSPPVAEFVRHVSSVRR